MGNSIGIVLLVSNTYADRNAEALINQLNSVLDLHSDFMWLQARHKDLLCGQDNELSDTWEACEKALDARLTVLESIVDGLNRGV